MATSCKENSTTNGKSFNSSWWMPLKACWRTTGSPLDFSSCNHEFDDDGKILIHPFCHGSGIHLFGCCRGRHGQQDLNGFAQDQAKILVLEREGKLRGIRI